MLSIIFLTFRHSRTRPQENIFVFENIAKVVNSRVSEWRCMLTKKGQVASFRAILNRGRFLVLYLPLYRLSLFYSSQTTLTTMSEPTATKPEEKPRSTAEVDFTKYKVHRVFCIYFFTLLFWSNRKLSLAKLAMWPCIKLFHARFVRLLWKWNVREKGNTSYWKMCL